MSACRSAGLLQWLAAPCFARRLSTNHPLGLTQSVVATSLRKRTHQREVLPIASTCGINDRSSSRARGASLPAVLRGCQSVMDLSDAIKRFESHSPIPAHHLVLFLQALGNMLSMRKSASFSIEYTSLRKWIALELARQRGVLVPDVAISLLKAFGPLPDPEMLMYDAWGSVMKSTLKDAPTSWSPSAACNVLAASQTQRLKDANRVHENTNFPSAVHSPAPLHPETLDWAVLTLGGMPTLQAWELIRSPASIWCISNNLASAFGQLAKIVLQHTWEDVPARHILLDGASACLDAMNHELKITLSASMHDSKKFYRMDFARHPTSRAAQPRKLPLKFAGSTTDAPSVCRNAAKLAGAIIDRVDVSAVPSRDRQHVAHFCRRARATAEVTQRLAEQNLLSGHEWRAITDKLRDMAYKAGSRLFTSLRDLEAHYGVDDLAMLEFTQLLHAAPVSDDSVQIWRSLGRATRQLSLNSPSQDRFVLAAAACQLVASQHANQTSMDASSLISTCRKLCESIKFTGMSDFDLVPIVVIVTSFCDWTRCPSFASSPPAVQSTFVKTAVQCYALIRRRLEDGWLGMSITQPHSTEATATQVACEILAAIEDDITKTGVVSQGVNQRLNKFVGAGGYQAVVELLSASLKPRERDAPAVQVDFEATGASPPAVAQATGARHVVATAQDASFPTDSTARRTAVAAAVTLDPGSDCSSDDEDDVRLASMIRMRSHARGASTQAGLSDSGSESESDSDNEGQILFGEHSSNNAELLRILRLLRVDYSAGPMLAPAQSYGQTQCVPLATRLAVMSTICSRPSESEVRMYASWQDHVRKCFSFIWKSCSLVPSASNATPAPDHHLYKLVATIAFLRSNFPVSAWTILAQAIKLAYDDPLDPDFTLAKDTSTTMESIEIRT